MMAFAYHVHSEYLATMLVYSEGKAYSYMEETFGEQIANIVCRNDYVE